MKQNISISAILREFDLNTVSYGERYQFYKENSPRELLSFFKAREYDRGEWTPDAAVSKEEWTRFESYFRDCEACEIWYRVTQQKEELRRVIWDMTLRISKSLRHHDQVDPASWYFFRMCGLTYGVAGVCVAPAIYGEVVGHETIDGWCDIVKTGYMSKYMPKGFQLLVH